MVETCSGVVVRMVTRGHAVTWRKGARSSTVRTGGSVCRTGPYTAAGKYKLSLHTYCILCTCRITFVKNVIEKK